MESNGGVSCFKQEAAVNTVAEVSREPEQIVVNNNKLLFTN